VRALKNIKAASLEGYLLTKVDPQFRMITRDFFYRMSVMAPIRMKVFEFLGILLISILLYVSYEVLGVPISEVLVSIAILFRLVPTVSGLLGNISHVVGGLASFDVIEQIKSGCQLEESGRGETIQKIEGIHFKQLSFAYAEASPLFSNLDFEIRQGEFWAICGPTGVGKSTLLDLCSGLLPLQEGDIQFDGRSLSGLSVSSVHQRIGYLTQHHYLFEGSLKENLTWGAGEDISEEALNKAIEISQLAPLVKERGLDFRLTESGQNLSGGERQRVVITRALLSPKDFLLMDEPSSALDLVTEKNFFTDLRSLKGKVGLLVITHRPEFLNHADGVIHIDHTGARVERKA